MQASVFISYTRTDRHYAEQLAQRLQQEHDTQVFNDPHSFPELGSNYMQQVTEAIRACAANKWSVGCYAIMCNAH